AVQTAHTGDALKAMLEDLATYAKEGPTSDEAEKTRLLARADLVETFESSAAAAHRMAPNAGVGLPADHEVAASRTLDAANREALAKLAAQYVDPTSALIVIVGPRKAIEPQLAAIGMTKLVAASPEGE